MKIKMSYDNPKISEAIISNDIILKEYKPKQASPMTEKELKNKLKNKLEKPIFANSLKSELENKKEILLLSDDNTRTTNAKIIIDTLIELFPEKNFSIIICLGTHRKMKYEEIEKKFGKKIIDRCKIFQHDWIKATYHDFGITNSGIPVLINDIIDNYDYIIGIGQVVPHRCTGFSGGTKIMQPGISAGKTTEATHWLSAEYKAKDIMGIRDNPIRKELDEIGMKAGLKFIINVVQDNHHQIVDFFCGDPVEAHRAAAEKTKEIFGFKVEPAEIVISESHPADIELWQASKGIYSAVAATKPGGTLILVTPCPEGISKTFGKELLKYGYKNTYKEIKKLFESGKISNGILAAHIVHAGEILFKARKVLVVSPGLTKLECKKMGLEKVESLQEAVDKSLKEYSNPRVSVMKFAADLLPNFD